MQNRKRIAAVLILAVYLAIVIIYKDSLLPALASFAAGFITATAVFLIIGRS